MGNFQLSRKRLEMKHPLPAEPMPAVCKWQSRYLPPRSVGLAAGAGAEEADATLAFAAPLPGASTACAGRASKAAARVSHPATDARHRNEAGHTVGGLTIAGHSISGVKIADLMLRRPL